MDVKEVPAACIAGDTRLMGEKFYQFTAIDEYSRFRCMVGTIGIAGGLYRPVTFCFGTVLLIKKFPNDFVRKLFV